MLVYKNNKDAKTATEIKKLVKWILTTGQNINGQLEYTRIPQGVAQRAIAEVNKIK